MLNLRFMRYRHLNYKILFIYILIFLGLIFLLKSCLSPKDKIESMPTPIPEPITQEGIDHYKNVAVYYNGTEYTKSHGKHYSPDGYYYGLKWQCVEYVKRFYYEAKKHPLPNLFGNAKDFYDSSLAHGEFNADRGLVQYKNGGNIAPMPDDILVFTYNTYGHVAIITEVGADYIEIIQQNVGDKTREKLKVIMKNNSYFIEAKRPPIVWLRKI